VLLLGALVGVLVLLVLAVAAEALGHDKKLVP
jgi:hypothetical protein